MTHACLNGRNSFFQFMSQTLSVITTVYNREAFLSECIESVLASSFDDFEYIIVDDSSTDGSYKIAKDYARRDKRVHVYRNDQNLGQFANRNHAVSYCNGQYIKFVDSDDVIYQNTLEIMSKSMLRYPEAVAGLSHYSIDPVRPQPILMSPKEAYEEHFFRRGFLHYGPTFSIYKRNSFLNIGGFPDGSLHAETIFLLNLACQNQVVSIVPGLAWWRRHDAQEYAPSYDQTKSAIDMYALNREALLNTECPLGEDRTSAIKRLNQSLARKMWSNLYQRRYKDAWLIKKKGKLTYSELLSGLKPYR